MAVISTISHLLLFPGSIDPNKLSQNHRSTVISLKGRFFRNPRSSKLVALASGGGANANGEIKEEKEAGDHWEAQKRDRRLTFTLRWRDLLNPDPENILAVGLTGLLAWASVQVLWQVFFISFAIVLAALKVTVGLSDPRERNTSSLINFPVSMANALVFRQSLLHRSHLPAFPRSIFFPQAIRFASGSSSSAPPTRRSPPPPPHEFLKPCDFLGSWKPPSDPREAEARLDRLRKDYAKQIALLRKEYSLEMEILRAEKQRKDEAKREAIRQANEKRKAAKSAAEETLAVQRKAFQEEFRQTLLNERAEKLESWRKKEQLREQKKTEKKHLLRQQSSMWISEENLDKRILEAIVDTTPL